MSDQKPAGAKNDEVLLGVPVEQLPLDVPWTFADLGHERYYAIATFGGYFTGAEPATFTPALDPRTFAHGVAWKMLSGAVTIDARLPLAERTQIITDILHGKIAGNQLAKYFPPEFAGKVSAIVAEADKLAAYINEKLGATVSTQRNAEAVAFAEALSASAKKQR